MNDTPRTDSELHRPVIDYNHGDPYAAMDAVNTDGEWVPADFARELEREIAMLRSVIIPMLPEREDDGNKHDGYAVGEISYGEWRAARAALAATDPKK
jgi:hypothetical protein